MALTFGKIGKLNTITGVYEKQTVPIVIGAVKGTVGPHYFGYSLGDDYISFNTYFDPALSQCSKMMAWDAIGYIQVGLFYLNGFPLSVRFHDDPTLLPVPDFKATDFVDTPRIIRDEQKNIGPYYVLWEMHGRNNVTLRNLFKYPSGYGSLTRADGTGFAKNEYLVAAINKNIQLGTGSLPSEERSLEEFFKQLDFRRIKPYRSINRDIDLTTSPEEISNQLIKDQLLPAIGNRLKSFVCNNQRAGYVIGYSYSDNITGYGQNSYCVFTYQGGNFYLLDEEDIIEFLEDPVHVIPDLDQIRESIYKETGAFIFLLDKKIEISYRQIAFPCSFREYDNTVTLQPLEGLEWTVAQTNAGGVWARPVMKTAPQKPAAESKLIWENSVRKFLAENSNRALEIVYSA
jgi:hypothetical protein